MNMTDIPDKLRYAQRSSGKVEAGDPRIVYDAGHWMWLGSMRIGGSGRHYANVGYEGKHHEVTRLLWEIDNGPIPQGRSLSRLATCTVDECVKPAHQVLTAQEGNAPSRRQHTPRCGERGCRRSHVARGKCRPHYDLAFKSNR